MRESHADKPISFLMEFIFVFFFFTLASTVCMLVLGAAKDKNNLTTDTRSALQYGENLVAQRRIPRVRQAIQKEIFYLNENRNRSSSQARYHQVEIEQKKAVEESSRALCELCIYHDDRELVRFPFLLEEGAQR